jgi:hypothetical protein
VSGCDLIERNGRRRVLFCPSALPSASDIDQAKTTNRLVALAGPDDRIDDRENVPCSVRAGFYAAK